MAFSFHPNELNDFVSHNAFSSKGGKYKDSDGLDSLLSELHPAKARIRNKG
ncbi:hypothetical protein D3C86_954140 [compost metagenome]